MKKFLIYASVLTIVSVIGCTHKPAFTSITATGSSIDQAHAHVDSAESANQAIKPHADTTGQALVGIVSTEHQKADAALVQAQKELTNVLRDADALTAENNKLAATNQELLHSWGHRLQVTVNKVFWTLVTLAVLHAALASAAFVLPLVFPAGTVAVPFLSLGAKIINPLGWFTVLAGHAQTRYLMVASAKPGVN